MRETYGSNTLDFFYDANGTPYALKYNGTVYYYITNLQGDVIQIVDASGNAVATYEYDPYGKVISATGTLAETNPIRYRGYYYDTETGLYYLQSRYYDPTVGRFISADSIVSTGQGVLGNNMFAYCLNNPIHRIDPSGTLAYPGEIHNEVVRRISDKYGFKKEQIILYRGGGFGRADLISQNGQVWDVKRDKPRQIKAGKKQVQKYVENTWARSPETPLSVGGNEIETGYFYHKSGLTTYKVTYRYAGDGVIAYDYRVSNFDYQTLTTALIIGIASAAGIVAGLPSGAIAYLGLV